MRTWQRAIGAGNLIEPGTNRTRRMIDDFGEGGVRATRQRLSPDEARARIGDRPVKEPGESIASYNKRLGRFSRQFNNLTSGFSARERSAAANAIARAGGSEEQQQWAWWNGPSSDVPGAVVSQAPAPVAPAPVAPTVTLPSSRVVYTPEEAKAKGIPSTPPTVENRATPGIVSGAMPGTRPAERDPYGRPGPASMDPLIRQTGGFREDVPMIGQPRGVSEIAQPIAPRLRRRTTWT